MIVPPKYTPTGKVVINNKNIFPHLGTAFFTDFVRHGPNGRGLAK